MSTRLRCILASTVAAGLVLALAPHARADQAPAAPPPVDLAPQSVSVSYGSPPDPGATGGFVGTSGYWQGLVTIAPRIERPDADSVHVNLADNRVTEKDEQFIEASGLAILGFHFAIDDFRGNPGSALGHFQGVFDVSNGTATTQKTVDANPGSTDFVVPRGATRLASISMDLSWNTTNEHLVFDAGVPVSPSQIRYLIDTLQFDDSRMKMRKSALDTRIDGMQTRLDESRANEGTVQSAYVKVRDVAYKASNDLGDAMAARNDAVAKYQGLLAANPDAAQRKNLVAMVDNSVRALRRIITANPGTYASTPDYQQATADLKAARDELTAFDRDHPNVAPVAGADQAQRDIEAAQAKVAAAEATARDAIANERQAARALADAKATTSSIEQSLVDLLAQQRDLALQSSLKSVTATADGRTVFAAQWDHDGLAKALQDLQDVTKAAKDSMDALKAGQDRAEADLMGAFRDEQAALDTLVDQIKTRGWVDFGAQVLSLGQDALSGAVTGGPIGAFVGLLSGVLTEQLDEHLQGEDDMRKQAEALLNADDAAPVQFQPPKTSAALRGIAEQGAHTGMEVGVDLTAEGAEKVLEPISELLKEALSGNTGLSDISGLKDAIARQAASATAVQQATATASQQLAGGAWKQFFAAHPNLVKGGAAAIIGAATNVALNSAKDQARANEATAWGDYITSDRLVRALRTSYIVVSEAYWKLRKEYNAALDAQMQFFQQATKTSLFHVTTSLPFPDGATVSITTDPPLTGFAFIGCYLGGEQADLNRDGSALTVRARGLAFHGDDPRQTTLELSLGGTTDR